MSFGKAWKAPCKAAGCPGKIPHDLRRTAVRNFVRRGISEHTAMKLSGHKTASVFRRYDIVSGDDLRDAAARLNDAGGPGRDQVKVSPSERTLWDIPSAAGGPTC